MDYALVFCEECTSCAPSLQCTECEQKLCMDCDEQIHKGGKRRTHVRVGLCFECKGISTQYCYTCFQNLCDACIQNHSTHDIKKIKEIKNVAIYWDLNSARIITGNDLTQTLKEIEQLFDSIEIIKVYGQSYYKWKDIFDAFNVQFSLPEGLRESEAMLIDISLLNKEKISHILVISSKASYLKTHLTQIQSSLPKIKILVSLTFPEITQVLVNDLQTDTKNYLIPPKRHTQRPLSNDHTNIVKATSDQFPVHQNFPRKKGQTFAHDHLLTYLKELADSGIIMHDAGLLCKNFSQKSRMNFEQSSNVIRELERIGYAHTVERTFCDLKTMFFTSLKLESLSLECLL